MTNAKSKIYSITLNGKVVFGPKECSTDEVKAFIGKQTPENQKKCKIQVSNPSQAAVKSAEVAPAVVADVVKQPEPEAPVEHVSSGRSVDDIFNNFVSNGNVGDFWKPKEGRNLIRILPLGGVLPHDWVTPYPLLASGVHSRVGESLQESVCCPKLTFGRACPICAWTWQLYNTKDPENMRISKDIRSYKRILANIIDLSNVEAGVQVWAFGKKMHEKIQTYKRDQEYIINGRDFIDAENGRNFIVIMKKVDSFPNYDDSRPEIKVTPLSAIMPDWNKHYHDLREEVKEKSYDELMAVLQATKKALLNSSSPAGASSGYQAPSQEAPSSAVDNVEEVSLEDLDDKLSQL